MTGSRILFCTPRFPLPLIGGDRVKSYHMLKHLARTNDVHLVTFHLGKTPNPEHLAHMQALGVTVHALPVSPMRAGLRCVNTLYTNLPLEITFYTQPEYQALVDELCERIDFDLGIAFFMRTAEYLRNKPFYKVLVAEDCRELYQQRSYENSRKFQQRLIRWWEVRKLHRYEPEVVNHYDTTTFVTQIDIDAMRINNPAANYQLLSNGVDLDKFAFEPDQSNRDGVLYFGKLDVWSNHLMVVEIAETIRPLIKDQAPGTQFRIVGSQPKDLVPRYADEDFQFFADVPDISLYANRSAVFLHPHRGASGIQNKVLEAMSMGCPVVTTPTGIQGIEAVHDEHVLVSHSEEEMASNCVRLLRDPELRERLARNARDMVERTRNWNLVYEQLDAIIEPAVKVRNGTHNSTGTNGKNGSGLSALTMRKREHSPS